jgi:hypothetical protein
MQPSHPNETALLDFLARSPSPEYVLEHIDWIRQHYPGSLASMEPRLRALHKTLMEKRK